MPMIPGYCKACGKALASDVYIKDNTYHLEGQAGGRCPCGGEIRLLDGTYCQLGGPINFSNAPIKEQAEWKRLCHESGHPELFFDPA